MNTLRILSMSMLLALSGAALAQVTPTPEENGKSDTRGSAMTNDASWDDLDSNRDGYLTKSELKGSPALVHNFDRLDTDHDGKVSQAEWQAWGKSDRMKDHDKDH